MQAMEHIQAKAAALGEGPPGPRLPISETQEAGNGGYVQHYSTGDIYWHPQTGAQWVYGAIRAKYVERGGPSGPLGYPTTDETATLDELGRYNHFEKGSIYYSPQTGAHDIRGPVLDRWSSLGREKSYLGYPTTDHEREQLDFERGTITCKSGGVIFDVSDTRVIKTGVIHVDGAAANGYAELVISSNGSWTYSGSMRTTGLLSYDVAMATVLLAGDQAIAFGEEGNVEGTAVLFGRRYHDWRQQGHDPRIQDNFDLWRTARAETTFKVNFGLGDVLAHVGSYYAVVGTIGLVLVGGYAFAANYQGCGWIKQRRYDHHTGEYHDEHGLMFVPKGQPCPPGSSGSGPTGPPHDPGGPEGDTVGGGGGP